MIDGRMRLDDLRVGKTFTDESRVRSTSGVEMTEGTIGSALITTLASIFGRTVLRLNVFRFRA